MFQMTLNRHAKFHGDRTIGGAITLKKASKHSISKVNLSRSIIIKKTVEHVCVCVSVSLLSIFDVFHCHL